MAARRMKVGLLDEKNPLAFSSNALLLQDEATPSCGTCVSVGDIIEDYEENTLRYVVI